MVVTLESILKSDTEDLNRELRRAFRPLTSSIDISDSVVDALTILVNLTDRVEEQKDLLNRITCKQKLRDEKWWIYCLNTVKARQSHNVKFPDIRAKGTIRAKPLGIISPYILSSSKLPSLNWSYSNDSKYVNKAAFLTSEFIWSGQEQCLGQFLKDIDHPLWEGLKTLGCLAKTRRYISKSLSKIPNQVIDVDLEPNHLVQISLPDSHDSYISLSPVTSQALQSHCYQALEEQFHYSATTWFDRATNMGTTAMSCGGKFRMLHTLPKFSQLRHHYLSDKNTWPTKQSIHAMHQYLSASQWLLTVNQKRLRLNELSKDIFCMLAAWYETEDKDAYTSSLAMAEQFNAQIANTRYASQLAYEPSLTKLFQQLFTRLKEAPSKISHRECAQKESTLLLPYLKISGASAMSSSTSIGLPSMVAFFGFSHAFERNIKNCHPKFKVTSFAVCVHSAHTENRGLTREYVQKTNGSISPPAIQDNWQCDLEVSLLLKCEHCDSITQTEIVAALPKRLARGKVTFQIKNIDQFRFYKDTKKAIKSIPIEEGHWLALEKNLGINTIHDVLRLLKENKKRLVNSTGYQLLEEPKEKPNSLRGYKHAFAETVLAILKAVPITMNSNLDDIFWEYHNSKNLVTIQPRSSA